MRHSRSQDYNKITSTTLSFTKATGQIKIPRADNDNDTSNKTLLLLVTNFAKLVITHNTLFP